MSGYISVALLAVVAYALATSDIDLGDVGDGSDGSGGSDEGDELEYSRSIYEDYLDWGVTLPWAEGPTEAEFRDRWESLSDAEKREMLGKIR